MNTEEKKELHKIYYNPETGFRNAYTIFKIVRDRGFIHVKYNDVKDWINKQPVKQIFAKKHKNEYNSFIPKYPLYQFQIDIIYMIYRGQNKYLLTCIDTLTKIGDVEILHDKSADSAFDGFMKIVERMGKPETIYSDSGKEFNNKLFKEWADTNQVTMYFTLYHAPIVERFNLTLKNIIYRYISHYGNDSWKNELPKFIVNYNRAYHRTIGMAPYDAILKWNKARTNLMMNSKQTDKKEKMKIGDYVRVVENKTLFSKGYLPNWSLKAYKIIDIDDNNKFTLEGHDKKYIKRELKLTDVLLIDEPDNPTPDTQSQPVTLRRGDRKRTQTKRFGEN